MTAPKPNALPWLALSALVIALDQWTKHIAVGALEYLRPVAVIPGFLNWTLAYNTGAAFSFLHDAGGWQRWLFTIIAIVASIVFAFWLARTRRGDWRNAVPLALIIGGALGNLVDRLIAGKVTDFIEVYWRDWSFPAFNVADSAVCVGAFLLIVLGLVAGKPATSGG